LRSFYKVELIYLFQVPDIGLPIHHHHLVTILIILDMELVMAMELVMGNGACHWAT